MLRDINHLAILATAQNLHQRQLENEFDHELQELSKYETIFQVKRNERGCHFDYTIYVYKMVQYSDLNFRKLFFLCINIGGSSA